MGEVVDCYASNLDGVCYVQFATSTLSSPASTMLPTALHWVGGVLGVMVW